MCHHLKHLEKQAERTLQGECTAKKRLSEAQVEIDRKSWDRKNLKVLRLKPIKSLNDGIWSFFMRIGKPVKLKEETVDYSEKYHEEQNLPRTTTLENSDFQGSDWPRFLFAAKYTELIGFTRTRF